MLTRNRHDHKSVAMGLLDAEGEEQGAGSLLRGCGGGSHQEEGALEKGGEDASSWGKVEAASE